MKPMTDAADTIRKLQGEVAALRSQAETDAELVKLQLDNLRIERDAARAMAMYHGVSDGQINALTPHVQSGRLKVPMFYGNRVVVPLSDKCRAVVEEALAAGR